MGTREQFINGRTFIINTGEVKTRVNKGEDDQIHKRAHDVFDEKEEKRLMDMDEDWWGEE